MRTITFRLILFVLLMPVLLAAKNASDSDNVHSKIQKVYNFSPHSLTKEQISEKSAVLDQFWAKAKAEKAVYVPALRKELSDFSNPPFFLYDGSNLLLSLSDDRADRRLILAAVSHSDLKDVQPLDYFLLVHKMAAEGENTTEAAFHILKDPTFTVFIVQHSLTLAQDYCLIYMLLPVDQALWLAPAINQLRDESDLTAQKSLLLLLFYSQTAEADTAMAEFFKDVRKPQPARDYAGELMKRKDSMPAGARSSVAGVSENSLRKDRRERMKAVSDEALLDLDEYTAKIMVKRATK
jgi:hypothetical protein